MFLHIVAGPRAGCIWGAAGSAGRQRRGNPGVRAKSQHLPSSEMRFGTIRGARAVPQVPDDAVTVAWRAPSASALADCFAYPHFLAVAAPSFAGTERPLSARTQESAAVHLAVQTAPQKPRGQRDSAASTAASVGAAEASATGATGVGQVMRSRNPLGRRHRSDSARTAASNTSRRAIVASRFTPAACQSRMGAASRAVGNTNAGTSACRCTRRRGFVQAGATVVVAGRLADDSTGWHSR